MCCLHIVEPKATSPEACSDFGEPFPALEDFLIIAMRELLHKELCTIRKKLRIQICVYKQSTTEIRIITKVSGMYMYWD